MDSFFAMNMDETMTAVRSSERAAVMRSRSLRWALLESIAVSEIPCEAIHKTRLPLQTLYTAWANRLHFRATLGLKMQIYKINAKGDAI